jgi:plasmid segregation protein ParM
MIISIDHGNKQIKTAHRTFVSGLTETKVRPALGEDFIKYNDSYYTLTDHRLAYQRDKSNDESFFLLTLFGVASEIQDVGAYDPTHVISVDLLIGLPPAHYGAQYKSFEQYFERDVIDFEFGSRPFSIYFNSATAYPQAYAAAMTVFSQIRPLSKCVVIDIGGYTADYLILKYGAPDMASCSSLEHGVILLYNQVINAVNSAYDLLLDESDVDSVLRGCNEDIADDIQNFICEQTQIFVEDLFSQLRELLIDLRVTRAIFVGGGSILLKPYIEKSPKVGKAIFVDDINANAKGYEVLFKVQHVKG